MSERFEIISENTFENVLFRGFPVIPEKSRITFDTQTNKMIIQFKYLNIGEKIVDTVYIKVNCFDVAKELIASVDEHIISMANAKKGESFGEKNLIYMEDKRISCVESIIIKVVFKDGEVWANTADSMGESVAPAKPVDIPADLRGMFNKESARLIIKTNCKYENFGTYWRCSCGMLNEGDICCKCGAETNDLKLVFSTEYLQKQLDENIENEKNDRYNNAVNLLNSSSLDDVKNAGKIFESLLDYKNSEKQIGKCRQRISELEAKLEKERLERSEAMAKASKKKKIILGIVSCAVAVGIALAVAVNTVIIPNHKYNNAVSLYESGNYEDAITAFEAMNGYKDSVNMIEKSRDKYNDEKYNEAVSLYENGSYKDAMAIFGTIYSYKDSLKLVRSISEKYSKNISAGGVHTVGLKSDGTVVAVGDNYYGECKVSKWTNISSVSAGNHYTVGLRSDGNIFTLGDNDNGRRTASAWIDISSVSAGGVHTVGLKSDGTAIAVGNNYNGECNVSDWTDIVAVSAGMHHTVGLRSDGTVVAVGDNYSGRCNVSGWTDIVAVSAGMHHTVGLRSDGTVVAVGSNGYGQCNVSDWTDIVAVSAGMYHTVGLRSDGTVVAVGGNDHGSGQCNVSDWTDIAAVSAGDCHTVGLKSDGTVVAAGLNQSGQCDVSGWKLKTN